MLNKLFHRKEEFDISAEMATSQLPTAEEAVPVKANTVDSARNAAITLLERMQARKARLQADIAAAELELARTNIVIEASTSMLDVIEQRQSELPATKTVDAKASF